MKSHPPASWRDEAAVILTIILSSALLSGALISQHVGHLRPCELCLLQRWPHCGALALAILSLSMKPSPARRALTAIAGELVIASGIIGLYHAGVEWKWWVHAARCSEPMGASFSLDALLAQPVVRCDEAQWRLLGLSLAGWNAILSLAGGYAVVTMSLVPRRSRNPAAA